MCKIGVDLCPSCLILHDVLVKVKIQTLSQIWLSELPVYHRKHWNSILNRFLLMTSFHALLTLIYCFTFLILWPLSSTASSISLILILFCLFWICTWNIQMRWSFYVLILLDLLSCDSSSMCKKFCSCFCIPLHSWWRFYGLLYSLNLFPYVIP